MDIRNRRSLHASAREAVAAAPGQPNLAVLIYSGTSCLLALASSFLTYYLDSRIANTGGLGNMGLRSILSTIQTILPIVQTLVVLVLELGYHRVVLNIARGQASGPRTLQEGLHFFGPAFRAQIILGLLYFAIGTVSANLASYLFMILPVSNSFYAIILPMLDPAAAADQALLMEQMLALDDATISALAYSLIPYVLICIGVFALLFIPIYYRYRMVTFCLVDRKGCGAMAAMRISRIMMRRNRFALFRVDLSLWWYYLLQVLVSVICYGGILLSMVGITLPFPSIVNLFLFPVVSLIVQFAAHYFVLNRVYTTYAQAYEALKPQAEEHQNTIFPFPI